MRAPAAVLVALALAAPAAAQQHGFVSFPRDEHQHVDGWDYWWGTADLVAESGNRYTLAIGHVIFNGAVPASSYILFPRQGPYEGRSVMTVDGPPEWGHPGDGTRVLHDNSRHLPGVSELLALRARDAENGMAVLDSWERTTLDEPHYRLTIDQDDAKLHPDGDRLRFGADLDVLMRETPLLAGGTGQWWYGIPQTYGYPSRSYQYMQAAERLSGTFEVAQPDGTVLRETVDPDHSRLLLVHEYDATPEDIPGHLVRAEATQLHPRYVQTYNYDWPWELIYADLDNGGGVMLAILNFNDTEQGTLRPLIGPGQPTFAVLATVQLPDGRSVALPASDVNVEHLSRRFYDGMPSASGSSIISLYTMSWTLRMSYPGGTVDGVDVPAFDLGFVPPFDESEPLADANGNRMSQRVPFDVAGRWAGCPIEGFAWSEMLVNWYGQEETDPWFTGGELPPVPKRCGAGEPIPYGTPQSTTPTPNPPPDVSPEGCSAYAPGTPRCEIVATGPMGVGGMGGAPGDWSVTIHRPGRAEPIVIRSHAGQSMYPCGTIRKGDRVVLEAHGDAVFAFAGDPLICF